MPKYPNNRTVTIRPTKPPYVGPMTEAERYNHIQAFQRTPPAVASPHTILQGGSAPVVNGSGGSSGGSVAESPDSQLFGDVTGTDQQTIVGGFQEVPISNAIPTNGQAFVYNSTDEQYDLETVGTVTDVSATTSYPGMTISVANPATTPAIAITPTGGLAANQVPATPNGATGPISLRALVPADLPTSAVTPGSYTNTSLTVDGYGRVTAAANGSGGGGGGGITALTGDVTASGTGSVAATLATVNSSPGSFGSASNTLTATVNAKGLITSLAATAISITSSAISNFASAVNALIAAASIATSQLTGTLSTALFPTSGVSAGSYTNTNLTVDTYGRVTAAASGSGSGGITSLTGDVTASGTGSVAATLATVNTNVGTFGSASQVATPTVNAKGLITGIVNTAISITSSAISNFTSAVNSLIAAASIALTQLSQGGASTGQVLEWNGTAWAPTTPSSASGTVTSVGLSLPSIFSVSGSPVTTTGTLTASLANETANTVLAGPASGSAATPTFRNLVVADVPGLPSAPRIVSITSSASPSINVATTDQYEITALATAPTIGITGTPVDGQKLMVRILDNGTAIAITWSSAFASSGIATLLSTTVASKTHLVGFIYDSNKSKFYCMAVDSAGY